MKLGGAHAPGFYAYVERFGQLMHTSYCPCRYHNEWAWQWPTRTQAWPRT